MATWASYAATQGNQRPPSSRNRLPTVAVLSSPAPPSAHQHHNAFALPVGHALLSQRHEEQSLRHELSASRGNGLAVASGAQLPEQSAPTDLEHAGHIVSIEFTLLSICLALVISAGPILRRRPPIRPFALAAARPARVRSSMRLRSNCAIEPRMLSTRLPVLPFVESPSSAVMKWTPRASRSSILLTKCASERPNRSSLKPASVSLPGPPMPCPTPGGICQCCSTLSRMTAESRSRVR
jgi:hypothetical protein